MKRSWRAMVNSRIVSTSAKLLGIPRAMGNDKYWNRSCWYFVRTAFCTWTSVVNNRLFKVLKNYIRNRIDAFCKVQSRLNFTVWFNCLFITPYQADYPGIWIIHAFTTALQERLLSRTNGGLGKDHPISNWRRSYRLLNWDLWVWRKKSNHNHAINSVSAWSAMTSALLVLTWDLWVWKRTPKIIFNSERTKKI